MGLCRAVICGLLLCFLAVSNCDEQEIVAARQAVVQANNQFSTAVYHALSNEPGNLVMSPLSVSAVMAMAWIGARGQTAAQLAAGLHLPENQTQVKTGFKNLLASLQSTQTVTLEIANKLFIQQEYGVKSTYRQTLADYFHSDAEEVNFAGDTEAVRTNINQWVEEKTHNKIKDLIKEGSLSPDTILVIVNAIYFLGGWRQPFHESDTYNQPFHLTPSASVNVSMMHQSNHLNYADLPELNAKALQMFYRGSNDDYFGGDATQSMLILLPNEIDGLASLEANITSLDLGNILSRLRTHLVHVTLPRFKVEKSLKLIEVLQQLGITDIFAPGADLSGISDGNIFVDKVVQKAFVEVTEKGTEAAAATYLVGIDRSAIAWPRSFFQADHPFLFMILDDITKTILFMGKVVDPN